MVEEEDSFSHIFLLLDVGFLLDVDNFLVHFQPFASGLGEVLLRVLRVLLRFFLVVQGIRFRSFGEALAGESLLQLLLEVQAHRLARYRHLRPHLLEEEEEEEVEGEAREEWYKKEESARTQIEGGNMDELKQEGGRGE